MKAKPLFIAATRLVIVLGLPTLLTAASLRMVLSRQFLHIAYSHGGIPADAYGFSTEDRLAYGGYAIDYVLNGETVAFLEKLRLPGEKCWPPMPDSEDCAMFTERELGHMRDVKRLTNLLFLLATAAAAAMFVLVTAAWSSPRNRPALLGAAANGSRLTLSALFGLALLAAGAWDRAFDMFHELFFAAGTWRFPFSDTLIRLYPEQLFVDAAIAMAALTGLGSIAVLLLTEISRVHISNPMESKNGLQQAEERERFRG